MAPKNGERLKKHKEVYPPVSDLTRQINEQLEQLNQNGQKPDIPLVSDIVTRELTPAELEDKKAKEKSAEKSAVQTNGWAGRAE